MNQFLFSVLILSVITFADVLITIKRPIYTKLNFLSLIAMIFIFNLLIFYNIKSGFLLIFTPLFNIITGSNLIFILNSIVSSSVYKWVKINLLIATTL